MKVIYSVGVPLGGGGLGNTSYNAVEQIYKAGILKKVICSENKKRNLPKEKVSSFKWAKYVFRYPLRGIQEYLFKNFNSPYWVDYIYDLLARTKIEKCDIFHYWRQYGYLSSKKARKLGAKIFVEHASVYPKTHKEILEKAYSEFGLKQNECSEKYLQIQLRELFNADYVVVPQGFAYESFIKNNFPKEKLVPVPFGIHLDKFKEIKKEKYDKIFRAVFVGRVSIAKGAPYLLEAWDNLRLKDAELIMVGEIMKEMKDLVKKYQKNKTIKFVGAADSLEYYKKSDIFVFPTLSEGSALVTYEALAAGLPQIVTENSGTPIKDGREGFIVPAGDSKAFEEKIRYLYNHPEKIKIMAKNGIELAKKYPWKNYGLKVIEAYKKALNVK
ncbi:MAG: glycosyltransferase family 4 protein [Nanobdellota archaeon]